MRLKECFNITIYIYMFIYGRYKRILSDNYVSMRFVSQEFLHVVDEPGLKSLHRFLDRLEERRS